MDDRDYKVHKQEILVIAKGAGIVFSGIIIGSGLRYVFQIITARNLGPELFGLFTIGFAIFKIASILAELGLPNGLVRYIAVFSGEKDNKRVKGVITASRNLGLLASLIVSALLFLLSKPIALYFFQAPQVASVIRFFSAAIPFATLTTVYLFATQGFKLMKYRVLVREIFEPFTRIILLLILSLLTWKLYGILVAYLIPTIIGTYISFSYLKKVFPEIRKKSVLAVLEIQKLLHFSLPLLFVQFFGIIILCIDTLMLGFYKSAAEVGIYGSAQRTALMGSLISTSFGAIFAPIISDLYNRNEFEKLRIYFQTVAKWIFSISFPILLLIILLSKHILRFFGPEFSAGFSSLILLCLGWICHSAVGSVGLMIIMAGRQKLHLIIMIVVLSSNIILNIIFIPLYGMIGAALATSISIALFNVVELCLVHKLFKIQPYRPDFVKPILAGTFSLIILWLLTHYIFIEYNLLTFALAIFVFLIVYVFFIIIFGLQEEDKIVLREMREKIFSYKIPKESL